MSTLTIEVRRLLAEAVVDRELRRAVAQLCDENEELVTLVRQAKGLSGHHPFEPREGCECWPCRAERVL